jgi:hypothetical protein
VPLPPLTPKSVGSIFSLLYQHLRRRCAGKSKGGHHERERPFPGYVSSAVPHYYRGRCRGHQSSAARAVRVTDRKIYPHQSHGPRCPGDARQLRNRHQGSAQAAAQRSAQLLPQRLHPHSRLSARQLVVPAVAPRLSRLVGADGPQLKRQSQICVSVLGLDSAAVRTRRVLAGRAESFGQ